MITKGEKISHFILFFYPIIEKSFDLADDAMQLVLNAVQCPLDNMEGKKELSIKRSRECMDSYCHKKGKIKKKKSNC